MAGPFNLFSRFSRFRRKNQVRGALVRHYTVTNPFHAVSVQSGYGCCQKALEYADRRFLSAEAPTLPLAGCDASRCVCRYQHHEDRRSGSRRLSDDSLQQNHFWRGQERRRERGRRVTDL